ncbi:MAG: hypothetical protein HGA87_00060 [Desulfobulbaceae bacterium]|nr:hypothetical protein [Desulfobulbaceae bacterium]
MKNIIMTALYGPDWKADFDEDDESLMDGWLGRALLTSVIYPFLIIKKKEAKHEKSCGVRQ